MRKVERAVYWKQQVDVSSFTETAPKLPGHARVLIKDISARRNSWYLPVANPSHDVQGGQKKPHYASFGANASHALRKQIGNKPHHNSFPPLLGSVHSQQCSVRSKKADNAV